MSETCCFREQEGYYCLPVLDNGCPTQAQLCEGAAWLKENLARGPVYVHCAAGHGRSATVVIAYLLSVGTVRTVEEGFALLRSKRPRVYLNPDQRAGLARFVACHLKGNAHNTDRRPGL
jgi:protein-tyrosine phosphatase